MRQWTTIRVFSPEKHRPVTIAVTAESGHLIMDCEGVSLIMTVPPDDELMTK